MEGRLKKGQVEVVADKIMDWGNLVFTGLVIGQLVPGTSPFRWVLLVLGILGITGAYTTAYFMLK